MGEGFKLGDEVFVSYLNDDNSQRDGWFYVIEVGLTASILKTKDGSTLFLPANRILKIKKKGEIDGR